jgi:proteasome accessory factor PafA2
MNRLFGIETEYGIVVEGLSTGDWLTESIAVVRSCEGPWVGGWNYRGEDPRRDMRGFTVQNLSTNPDDAQFDPPGGPTMSREEERSDRVLPNGARLYNDHGHPEYSTPECRSLWDLVAHDRAGERIVLAAARRRAAETGRAVTIYKNNTDFHGASYGTHECYLMRRDVPTETLILMLLPFFASRCIYAGAGKAGVENNGLGRSDLFQLSQRADFFSVEASVDTLHNRPLVNTRDEPHATPRAYRRLHVICGDANMSEYATALKVGTTCLVLSLLEQGGQPPLRLANPVQAAKAISRDITLKRAVERADGKPPITALEIQRLYLAEAQKHLQNCDEETEWVLSEWQQILDDLEKDPLTTADRLDWVAKYQLLEPFRQAEGLKWNDPHMQSLDLAYHNIDPEEGLYYGLEQAGQMCTLVTETRIQAAMSCPPADTRAAIRGLFVQRFAPAVRSIGWNGVLFRYNDEDYLFDMNPLVEENVRLLNEEFATARTLDDVIALLQSRPGAEETV